MLRLYITDHLWLFLQIFAWIYMVAEPHQDSLATRPSFSGAPEYIRFSCSKVKFLLNSNYFFLFNLLFKTKFSFKNFTFSSFLMALRSVCNPAVVNWTRIQIQLNQHKNSVWNPPKLSEESLNWHTSVHNPHTCQQLEHPPCIHQNKGCGVIVNSTLP